MTLISQTSFADALRCVGKTQAWIDVPAREIVIDVSIDSEESIMTVVADGEVFFRKAVQVEDEMPGRARFRSEPFANANHVPTSIGLSIYPLAGRGLVGQFGEVSYHPVLGQAHDLKCTYL